MCTKRGNITSSLTLYSNLPDIYTSSILLQIQRGFEKQDNDHKNVYFFSILENKNVDDFDVIATIGKGAFGSVTLSQLKGSETSVYAIKVSETKL